MIPTGEAESSWTVESHADHLQKEEWTYFHCQMKRVCKFEYDLDQYTIQTNRLISRITFQTD